MKKTDTDFTRYSLAFNKFSLDSVTKRFLSEDIPSEHQRWMINEGEVIILKHQTVASTPNLPPSGTNHDFGAGPKCAKQGPSFTAFRVLTEEVGDIRRRKLSQ